MTVGGQIRLCHDRREVHDWRSNGVPAAECGPQEAFGGPLNLIINQFFDVILMSVRGK